MLPQGLQSTKIGIKQEDEKEECKTQPSKKDKDVFVHVYNLNTEMRENIYIDQTGWFPTMSSQRNQYSIVMCKLDSNAILMEAMKNRTAGEMVRDYQVLTDRLHARGIRPKHHAIDKEISADLKLAIKNNEMVYQLVPPDNHQRNIAKKGIQTAKCHIISVLYGADPKFPMHLLNRLLRGVEL